MRNFGSNSASNSTSCIAFVHIPKNAGSHITWLLRSYFGTSHCRVLASNGVAYNLADWRQDALIYPHLRCLSGHRLRPHVEFEEHESKLQWATVLRDPFQRFPSQYRWYCKKRKLSWSFEQWCEFKGEQFSNFQTQWLCGEQRADKAWSLIERKNILVGDQANLEAFVGALAQRAGLPDFPLGRGKRVNVTQRSSSKEGQETLYDVSLIERYNAEDIALYEQCRAQGRFVSEHLKPSFAMAGAPRRIPYYLNLVKHVALYKPYRRLRQLSDRHE